MKLTYWYSRHPTDSDCYSIRTKTRREALSAIKAHWDHPERWSPPVKVTVEYDDGFDLLTRAMSERKIAEEAQAELAATGARSRGPSTVCIVCKGRREHSEDCSEEREFEAREAAKGKSLR